MAGGMITGWRPITAAQHRWMTSPAKIRYAEGANRAGKTILEFSFLLIQTLHHSFLPEELLQYRFFGREGHYHKAFKLGYTHVNGHEINPLKDWDCPIDVLLAVPSYHQWTERVFSPHMSSLIPEAAMDGLNFERWVRPLSRANNRQSIYLYDKQGNQTGSFSLHSYSPTNDPKKAAGGFYHIVAYDELPEGNNASAVWNETSPRLVDKDGLLVIAGTPDGGSEGQLYKGFKHYEKAGKYVFHRETLSVADNWTINDSAKKMFIGGLPDEDITNIKFKGMASVIGGLEWKTFNRYLNKKQSDEHLAEILKRLEAGDKRLYVVLGVDFGSRRSSSALNFMDVKDREKPLFTFASEIYVDKTGQSDGVDYKDFFEKIAARLKQFGLTVNKRGGLILPNNKSLTRLHIINDRSGQQTGRYGTDATSSVAGHLEEFFGVRAAINKSGRDAFIDDSYALMFNYMQNESFQVYAPYTRQWQKEHLALRIKREYRSESKLKSKMLAGRKDTIDAVRYALEYADRIIDTKVSDRHNQLRTAMRAKK